jgi:hypothetical protein
MIERKRKICSGCGTPQYIFSNKKCLHCYNLSKMEAPSVRKIPLYPSENTSQSSYKAITNKSGRYIPPRTNKRLSEEKEYKEWIAIMDADKNKYCFFCGEKMSKAEDHHHLAGRDGGLLTEKRYIVHAHRECHREYHDMPVDKLPWFDGFLNRLSDIDVELAERESFKRDK